MQENTIEKKKRNTNARRPSDNRRPAEHHRQSVSRDAAAVRKPVRRRRRRKKQRRVLRTLGAAVFALALLAVLVALFWNRIPKEAPRIYPMEYSELIRSNAAQQGLDPAHIAAVILAESSYDPNAVSSVNAQGLMQIMPDTGKWLAGKFDEAYYEGCLFDPATNIRYGSWYLGYLMRRYDGDLTCTTAAYHSGQGAVDKWLADPAFSADGKRLTEVKGENAKKYVSRVLEYYEKYQELYGPA